MSLINLSEDDWGELLQGDSITLGKTVVVIAPLSLAQLKSIGIKLKAVVGILKEAGVTAENFDTPEAMGSAFTVLVDRVPELLEEVTRISRDDIARLPLAKGVELLAKVVAVNMASQEALTKNLQALGEAIRGATESLGA